MIRIAALNDVSDTGSKAVHLQKKRTKEAQEAEAFAMYNSALLEQKQGRLEEAHQIFIKLLKLPLIEQAVPLSGDDGGVLCPELALKYSAYKNLASMAAHHNRNKDAMEFFLEAVQVDPTDVTVWYKIGKLALDLQHFSLARHSFEQGLEYSSKHWPCLDNIITIMYALNNYQVCLYYIAQALQRDAGYVKGLVFMRRIFNEQPSLRKANSDLFQQCDDAIYEFEVTEKEAAEFIDEAIKMRRINQELARVPDPPLATLSVPLTAFTWCSLGESLVALYDHICLSLQQNPVTDLDIPNVTLGCRVDLSRYVDIDPTAIFPPRVSTPPPPCLVPEVMDQQDTPDVFTDEQLAEIISAFELDEVAGGRQRSQKRKRLQWEEQANKRRSTRVRSFRKKDEEEVVDYRGILQKLLPPSLLYARSDVSDSEADSDIGSVTTNNSDCPLLDANDALVLAGTVPLGSESDGVMEFIRKRQCNGGVLSLIRAFLVELAQKAYSQWPDKLTELYLQAYHRLRKHILFPSFLSREAPDDVMKELAQICLVYCELNVDKGLRMHTKVQQTSPGKTPFVTTLGYDFPGDYFNEDLYYLVGVCSISNCLQEVERKFCVRVCWVKAQYLALQNDIELAALFFDKTTQYLSADCHGNESTAAPLEVRLPNCAADGVITEEEVNKHLDSLRRCQSHEQVQKLHDAGDHESVVALLLSTIPRANQLQISLPERHSQLLLLQDSLLKLKDYKRHLLWGEISLNEAVNQYNGCPPGALQEAWANTIVQLLTGLNQCLSVDITSMTSLPSKRLVRLTSSLMTVIQINITTSYSDKMSIETQLPWILLYRLTRYEEDHSCPTRNEKLALMADHVPASILLLDIAHEYLGRRSWCVSCDGELLLFAVQVLSEERSRMVALPRSHACYINLQTVLEQCFYCLYGHPNKRTKAKHLEDHNSKQIALTWEQAILVFDFFKPKTVPEFDSYKTSTVSGDLESLLKTISTLVPSINNPANTIDSITSYLEGLTTQPPSIPEGKEVTMPVVKELYYLLADYYFKNKEQLSKAIRFYLLDLCVNPDRLDSWAGMALARASRLEQKLNSPELKTERPVMKQASCILQCFKHALQLDDSNSKLWIEYGSLAYLLHSHASRQLKQQSQFGTADEDTVITSAPNFLQMALHCYKRAADSDDSREDWLRHYMLGKIAEKMNTPPSEYLTHYQQAAELLHNDRAKYPKRIPYMSPSMHLALEYLETYYRQHVCVMKYLLRNNREEEEEIPYDYLETYLDEVAHGNFAMCREKDKKDIRLETSEELMSAPVAPLGRIPQPRGRPRKRPLTPADHTYSKTKLSSESSGQSSQESIDVMSPPSARTNTVPFAADGHNTSDFTIENILSGVIERQMAKLSEPSNDELQSGHSSVTAENLEAPMEQDSSVNVQLVKAGEPCKDKAQSAHSVMTVESLLVPMEQDSHNVTAMESDVEVQPSISKYSPSPAQDLVQSSDSTTEQIQPSIMLPATVNQQQSVVDKAISISSAMDIESKICPTVSPSVAKEVYMPMIEPEPSLPPKASDMLLAVTTSCTPDSINQQSEKHTPDMPTSLVHHIPLETRDNLVHSQRHQDNDIANLEEHTKHTVDGHYTSNALLDEVESVGRLKDSKEVFKPDDQSRFDTALACSHHLLLNADETNKQLSNVLQLSPHNMKEDNVSETVISSSINLDVPASDTLTVDQVECETVHVQIPAVDIKMEDGTSQGDDLDVAADLEKGCRVTELENLKKLRIALDELSNMTPEESKHSPDEGLEIIKSEIQTLSVTKTEEQTMQTENERERENDAFKYEERWVDVGTQKEHKDMFMSVHIGVDTTNKQAAEKSMDVVKVDEPRKTNDKTEEERLNDEDRMVVKRLATEQRKDAEEPEVDEQKNSKESGEKMLFPETIEVDTEKPREDTTQRRGGDKNVDAKVLPEEEKMNIRKIREQWMDAEKQDKLQRDAQKKEKSVDEENAEEQSIDASKLKEQKFVTESQEEEEQLMGVRRAEDKRMDIGKQQEGHVSTRIAEKEIDLGKLAKDQVSVLNKNQNEGIDIDQPEQQSTCYQEERLHISQSDDQKRDVNTTEDHKPNEQTMGLQKSNSVQIDHKNDKSHSATEMKETDKTEQASSHTTATDKKMDNESRRAHILDRCAQAMRLCLSRFPQHYKSLYQLAFLYKCSPHHRNLQICRDLLWGSATPWQQLEHMPCPGLFQERKHNNFFQGIWRSLIPEIDRAGSFAYHLARSLLLTFEVLKEDRDSPTLLYIHLQLMRAPDQGKKYIRDADRLQLANLALMTCFDTIKLQLSECPNDALLVSIYQMTQKVSDTRLNELLEQAYCNIHSTKDEEGRTRLEEVIHYCQQLQHQRQQTSEATAVGRPRVSLTTTRPYLPLRVGSEEALRAIKPCSVRLTTTPDRPCNQQRTTVEETPGILPVCSMESAKMNTSSQPLPLSPVKSPAAQKAHSSSYLAAVTGQPPKDIVNVQHPRLSHAHITAQLNTSPQMTRMRMNAPRTRLNTPRSRLNAPRSRLNVQRTRLRGPRPRLSMSRSGLFSMRPRINASRPQMSTPRSGLNAPCGLRAQTNIERTPQLTGAVPQGNVTRTQLFMQRPQLNPSELHLNNPRLQTNTTPQINTPRSQINTVRPQMNTPQPQVNTSQTQINSPRPSASGNLPVSTSSDEDDVIIIDSDTETNDSPKPVSIVRTAVMPTQAALGIPALRDMARSDKGLILQRKIAQLTMQATLNSQSAGPAISQLNRPTGSRVARPPVPVRPPAHSMLRSIMLSSSVGPPVTNLTPRPVGAPRPAGGPQPVGGPRPVGGLRPAGGTRPAGGLVPVGAPRPARGPRSFGEPRLVGGPRPAVTLPPPLPPRKSSVSALERSKLLNLSDSSDEDVQQKHNDSGSEWEGNNESESSDDSQGNVLANTAVTNAGIQSATFPNYPSTQF